MNPTPKALVWDVGNVLVRWNHRDLYNQLITNPTQAEWWCTQSWSNSWNQLGNAGMGYDQANPIWQRDFETRHKDRIAEFPRYPELIAAYGQHPEEAHAGLLADSIALRDGLRSRFTTLALTNFNEGNWHKVNAAHGGAIDRFDHVVMSSREGVAKPEKDNSATGDRLYLALFNVAEQKFGLKPHEMLFIDDNGGNVQAARRLGMPSLQFESSAKLRHDLKAEYGIDTSHIPVQAQLVKPAHLGRLKPLM